MQGFKVAVAGATGNVGREMLSILAERRFPVSEVVALASSRSIGKEVSFGDHILKCKALENYDFSTTDICLMSAGGAVSKEWSPKIGAQGCVVIDNSSTWRMDPDVPLVVPEVNADAARGYGKKNIIANPNCSTAQLVVALKPLHDFDEPLSQVDKLAAAGAPEYGNYIMHWYDEYDAGLQAKWFAPELNDSDWKVVDLPGGFAELGVPDTPAVVWFRKEIDVPNSIPEGRTMVLLGSIEKMDTVYINGTEVGGSSWVENPREYFVRPGVLKPGRNLIAIRVFKTKPDGGFMAG